MTDVSATVKQRGSRYGSMATNAALTQALMAEVLTAARESGAVLTPMHRECIHMIMIKVTRMVCGDPLYADSPHDIAGYATLLEDYINELNGRETNDGNHLGM